MKLRYFDGKEFGGKDFLPKVGEDFHVGPWGGTCIFSSETLVVMWEYDE